MASQNSKNRSPTTETRVIVSNIYFTILFYSDRTLYQLRHQNNEPQDEPTRFERAPSKRKPEKKVIEEPEVSYVDPVTRKKLTIYIPGN